MPHIEISLAWSPGILPDFSPEAVNNDLPPHPCNRDFCIREREGKREKTRPVSSEKGRLAQSPQHCWQCTGYLASKWSGQKYPWHPRHFSRSLRTRREHRLIIFWDSEGVTWPEVIIP